ncbi:MAG: class I SAM-dependent methyltransferase [Actinobacteria bacterium]|nr:class I SAM-dependent methyltransferase [Actinomycetota bacterium]
MKPGQASLTARAVAAYRLGFERAPSPAVGDPAADDRLAATVADGLEVDRDTRMGRYLHARTAFFDGVVIAALGRGTTQVVNLGAGYDGRALRYRHAGVRWFEVDHPDTQADKRQVLDELGIDHADVRFVPVDLTTDRGLAGRLAAAGLDPTSEALVLWEGVVNYLHAEDVSATLEQLRRAVSAGSALAVSVSPIRDAGGHEDFARAVARVGEDAAPPIPPDAAVDLLARSGWEPAALDPADRRGDLFHRLGFLVAVAGR